MVWHHKKRHIKTGSWIVIYKLN